MAKWVFIVVTLVGSLGGATAYYELYVANTGVQLNSGKPLHRADLIDMVLISAVEEAQRQNKAAAEHASEP